MFLKFVWKNGCCFSGWTPAPTQDMYAEVKRAGGLEERGVAG